MQATYSCSSGQVLQLTCKEVGLNSHLSLLADHFPWLTSNQPQWRRQSTGLGGNMRHRSHGGAFGRSQELSKSGFPIDPALTACKPYRTNLGCVKSVSSSEIHV